MGQIEALEDARRRYNYALEYARYRYKYFPSEYFKVLRAIRFPSREPMKVLDIGCGPGNWTIAAANYNRNAEVIGIDINNERLQVAEWYREKFGCHNASFLKLDYGDVDVHFEPESFDYVLSMGVVMLLDENHYFRTVSRALRSGGQLVLFWNHGVGYYLQKMLCELRRRNAKEAFSEALLPLTIGLAVDRLFGGDHEHPLEYRRTSKIAERCGIHLQIKDLSSLCSRYYGRTYARLPNVFNMIGEKWSSRNPKNSHA